MAGLAKMNPVSELASVDLEPLPSAHHLRAKAIVRDARSGAFTISDLAVHVGPKRDMDGGTKASVTSRYLRPALIQPGPSRWNTAEHI